MIIEILLPDTDIRDGVIPLSQTSFYMHAVVRSSSKVQRTLILTRPCAASSIRRWICKNGLPIAPHVMVSPVAAISVSGLLPNLFNSLEVNLASFTPPFEHPASSVLAVAGTFDISDVFLNYNGKFPLYEYPRAIISRSIPCFAISVTLATGSP